MTADFTRASGPSADLRGASADRVRAALRDGNPFPGGRGFAGLLTGPPGAGSDDEPVLVRDVLGRQPLFVERGAPDPTAGDAWSFERSTLVDPEPVPAGAVVSADSTGVSGAGGVWSLPDDDPVEPAIGQAAVDAAIDDALSEIREEADSVAREPIDDGDDGGLAVAFSGGVDSGLIAAAVPNSACYVAGFEGCHDVAAAREAAEAMGRKADLSVVEITHDDLVRAIREVARATGRRNPMDVAIAVPLYLTAEAAAADGATRLAVGQGADELFGGYSKVVNPAEDDRVDAKTVRGARTETIRTLPDQLERDVLALRAAGIEPVAPLLDDRIVAAALALPGELLVADGKRKIALRRAATGSVPESVRTADKKAVQYGTYVSRELDRLARQAGFKRRMDDHVGQYLDALLSEK